MNTSRCKSSHRKQQIWVCVIAGLFLSDFILCGYLPSQQRLASLREARTQQRRTIDMAAAQNVELAGLKNRLRNTEKLIERFDARVPADEALGAFLQQVTTIMSEHRLTDPVILPGKKTETNELGCIPVLMTCKGTLTDLFDFLNRLQRLDRLVRIEKVTMENDVRFTGQLALRIQGGIFYQSKLLKAGAAGTAAPAGGVNHGS
jgi:Tfp pilus assembly protein PilO